MKARGEHHPNSKLKTGDIPVIRRRIREGHHGIMAHLAREYKVRWETIRDIRDGMTWNWVPD